MSSTRCSPLPAFDGCPCAGATLDKLLQPAVLTVLAREELHGYRIAERLAEMRPFHGQRPDVSGIYRSLRAMERRGLVVAAWDTSSCGPAKRLYTLTPGGRQCLERWVGTLGRYQEAVCGLLAAARRAVAAKPKRSGRRKSTEG
ncbi:MAG: PadR family transcriptional regulator [Planctomycetes bacterium]|nr:PadR family transcriptional regulator [Planctomycetota bacterium]